MVKGPWTSCWYCSVLYWLLQRVCLRVGRCSGGCQSSKYCPSSLSPPPPFFCSILKSVEPAPFPFDMGDWMWEHLFAGFFSALCLGSSYSRTDFLVKCATKSFTFRVHSVRGRLQRFLLYQHLVKDEDFYYIQKGNLAVLWVFRFLHWEGTRCWGVILWPVSSSVNLSWFGAEGHKDHLQVGFKSSNGYLCPKGFVQFINLYWAF